VIREESVMKKSAAPRAIRRFSAWRMLEHHLNALAFITLVVTGLSQKFHEARWAEWVILQLGGIDQTRAIHRAAGALFAFLLVLHLAVGMWGMLRRGWAPSMIVNRNDFRDAVHNLRFYFGMEDHPAHCDRFDYKQKFEYWGVIMGGVLMVATGAALWFPTLVFRLMPWLPGQVLPAAKVAHTSEATMAFLIIVTWHIYNAIFSPEVFPLDTTIFTGKISAERLKHEHGAEYDRLVAQGVIEPVPDHGPAPVPGSADEVPPPGIAPQA
jgi:formate dehydrogenase gamma subunit